MHRLLSGLGPADGSLLGPPPAPQHTPLPSLLRPPLAAQAEGGAAPTAALVHFGWAPAARAAHQMFGRVARFAEGSAQVTGGCAQVLQAGSAGGVLQASRHGQGRQAGRQDLRAAAAGAGGRGACTEMLTSCHRLPSPLAAVDDFELLSDCKATATLQLRAGAAPPASWDTLVCAFVDSL